MEKQRETHQIGSERQATKGILSGFFIELIQLVLPTRKFDILDALANTVGCFIAGGIILLISGKRA